MVKNGRRGTVVLLMVAVLFSILAATGEPYRVTGLAVPLTRHADRSRMTAATVTGVVDGDTVKLKVDDPPEGIAGNETVRLIGVDTPEVVDPRKPVQYFGREASAFTKAALLGTKVYLAFDMDLRDWFGRLLGYIFLENGSCFNLELVAQGYGFAYVEYPFFFMEEFRNAERGARSLKKGLWGAR